MLKTMPRLSTYPAPKAPARRSRSQHTRNRHHSPSRDHSSNSRKYDVPPPKMKRHTSTLESHLVASSGEFVGTFMFLYFAFACQLMLTNQASERSILNNGPSSQQCVFTALVYGFSLLVNVWAFFRISGGLFNPSVRSLMV